MAIHPSWLTPAVVELAQVTYDDQAFERMPLLVNALGDAGGGNREILRRLQGPVPHVRECFIVDLLLGKD